MKRWLRFAAVCLIFGAIFNVALAWWITAGGWRIINADQSQWRRMGPAADQAQLQWWSTNVPPGFSTSPAKVTSTPMSGVWTELMYYPGLRAERRRAGWPFTSLEGQRWYGSGASKIVGTWQLSDDRPWLPLQPMWPGFVADSALFGLIPLLPVAAFALARRSRRRRRHQCLHCGYPVGISPVCTECGRAVAQPPVR